MSQRVIRSSTSHLVGTQSFQGLPEPSAAALQHAVSSQSSDDGGPDCGAQRPALVGGPETTQHLAERRFLFLLCYFLPLFCSSHLHVLSLHQQLFPIKTVFLSSSPRFCVMIPLSPPSRHTSLCFHRLCTAISQVLVLCL